MTKFSDFINDFLNIFPSLSKLHKKVFRYLQWLAKKYRCVFPCILRIANSVGCGSATVKRATALFEQMGWLIKKKCPYQSNQYFLNDELISLNLDDKTLFFREERSENDPVLSSSSSDINLSNGTSGSACIKIPLFLDKARLSQEEKQRLMKNFSECALFEAVNDARWYLRQGNKIRSLMGFLY